MDHGSVLGNENDFSDTSEIGIELFALRKEYLSERGKEKTFLIRQLS